MENWQVLMADSAVEPRWLFHIFPHSWVMHDLQWKMHKWKRKTWSKTAGHQNGSLTIFPSATRLLFILDMACCSAFAVWNYFSDSGQFRNRKSLLAAFVFPRWLTVVNGGRVQKLIEPRRQFLLFGGEVPSIDSGKMGKQFVNGGWH